MGGLFLVVAHNLAAFGMAAILATEVALIRPGITGEEVVRLRRLDSIYGSLIGVILIVGILMVSHSPRGQDFYTQNPIFWLKIAAFVAVGILSILPTVRIYYWWQTAKDGGFFQAPENEVAKARKFLRYEAIAFATIPVFSVFASRGVTS